MTPKPKPRRKAREWWVYVEDLDRLCSRPIKGEYHAFIRVREVMNPKRIAAAIRGGK